MDSYSSGNSNGYKKSTCQYYTIRMYEIELMLVMDQKSKI